ncbi:mitochondrial thiamine pyrophosphate carrier [Exaiptasia diaphana]|uniref:Mitochondrial thiamine pyrophosphate carrier n=1 Tax=Exaiptasia diaphana TaxID=2652724 RepID=A0A913YLR6_EXADI|nr:mitochondrial thiamine pyrophosphate carrier [Exaiptasia diaphana]
MVGFDPNRVEKGLTSSQCGICGSIAGALTRVIAQPLDVVKIRFQLQVEPTYSGTSHKPTGKYTGVGQAFKLVYKEEGVPALWKGHVPAQILSIAYGYFQKYTGVGQAFKLVYKEEGVPALWKGHVPAQILSIAYGYFQVYSSLMEAARMMYTIEGPTAFYKGLVPSLLQIFPYAGMQFGSYTLLKMIWDYTFDIKKHNPYKPADIIESLFCGAVSGMISKGIILPIDIVKKRIQVQGFQEARANFGKVPEYTGLVDCVQSIMKYEGIAGLFKGLAPSTIKAGVSLGITFCAYEQCLHLMRHLIHDDMEDHVKDLTSR